MFKNLGLKTKMLMGSCGPLILVVFIGVFIFSSIQSLLTNNKMIEIKSKLK